MKWVEVEVVVEMEEKGSDFIFRLSVLCWEKLFVLRFVWNGMYLDDSKKIKRRFREEIEGVGRLK